MKLPTPPTEPQIAEVIRTLSVAGLGFMADQIRGLAFQRDQLKESLEGERLWIREGKKLHDVQKDELARLKTAIENIRNIASDPAFQSDAMGWIEIECKDAIDPGWIERV